MNKPVSHKCMKKRSNPKRKFGKFMKELSTDGHTYNNTEKKNKRIGSWGKEVHDQVTY